MLGVSFTTMAGHEDMPWRAVRGIPEQVGNDGWNDGIPEQVGNDGWNDGIPEQVGNDGQAGNDGGEQNRRVCEGMQVWMVIYPISKA